MLDVDPRLLPALAAFLLLPISALCLWYAIRADANARGADGALWGVLAFVFPLPVAPAYVLYRRRLPARTTPVGPTERRLGAVGIGVPAAWIVSFLLAPPDPFATLVFAVPLVLVSVPAAYLLCYDSGRRALGT